MFYEQALKLNSNNSKNAIKILSKFRGLITNIYYPLSQNTIYNDASQDYTYNPTPDITDRFIVIGLTDQRPLTELESQFFSNFTEGSVNLYTYGDYLDIPRNSKMEIFYNSSLYMYRVQDPLVVNGLDGNPVYGILSLVPIA